MGHGLRSSCNSYRNAIVGDGLAKSYSSLAFCASITALVLFVSCGGGSKSAGPVVQATPPPTVESFAPANGPVGTHVTITGQGFAGVTTVALNGSSLQFTVDAPSQLSVTIPAGAASGPFSVTNSNGTGTSTGRFWVTTSSALDLTIDGMYVTQATQTYPEQRVPLVKNRSAWIRVFVKANQQNTAAPDVRVRFINGDAVNSLSIAAPSISVPTYVDGNTVISWNAPVPAERIQPNVQIVADLDPSNAIAESDESNNQFAQTLNNVRALEQLKVTLFPVRTTDGLTGEIEKTDRTRDDWVGFIRRIYPVPDDIDVTVGSTMYSSVSHMSSSDDSWARVTNEVAAKRAAEGVSDRYYVGVVKTNYSSGTAGRSVVGSPVAVAWDGEQFNVTVAHEIGHSFNRQHSPCGNPAGTDPNYPYPTGNIGVTGWDVFAASDNFKPASYDDIMTYCLSRWISDYTYSQVLEFRDRNRFISPQTSSTAGTQEGLLVWGRIENGRAILEPAFRVAANGTLPTAGPYTWEARDAYGATLAAVSFDAREMSDLPAIRIFSFVVPLAPDTLNAAQDLRIRKDGQELARVARPIAAEPQVAGRQDAVRVEPSPESKLQISWNTNQYPMLLLRDAHTGEVRGFLRGGYSAVSAVPQGLEIHASDGIKSRLLQYGRSE